MMKELILGLAVPLLIPVFAFAQSANSVRDSSPVGIHDQRFSQGTPSEQAVRGDIPFSFADGRLKPGFEQIRRLPSTSFSRVSDLPSGILQVGILRDLELPLRFNSKSEGIAVPGGKIYLAAVESEGAKSIRVRLESVNLPERVRIFVFSLSNTYEFYGPFTKNDPLGNGSFWTPPIEGADIAIEVFVPSDIPFSTTDLFEIRRVSHSFADRGDCSFGVLPVPCHNEVPSTYASMATATGFMKFVFQNVGECLCTGTMLNTASSNFTPYFMTANHCVRSDEEAQSVRVYWNYNTGDWPPAGTPFSDGAILFSTSTESDFAFLKLTGTIPGGLTYMGWYGGDPALDTMVVGIHHPRCSHKRISFGSVVTTGSYCPGPPYNCNNFTSVTWNSGLTEPGSSGSGLFLTGDGGRFIGNLYGGLPDPPACFVTAGSAYGRFSLSYYKIASYLADAVCTYGISPVSSNFTSTGGNGNFNVTANGTCYQSPVITQPNAVQTFVNPATISIADRPDNSLPPGTANFYPSTINLSGFTGTVTRIRVIINGLSHTWPDDLDFLLESPTGERTLLVSDAGGPSPGVNNAILTVDQSGQTLIPDASNFSTGTYRPSNFAGQYSIDLGGIDDFPFPGPGQKTYNSSLEFFYGTNPNGPWKLYVADDEAGDVGTISGGWRLELATTQSSWLTVNSGVGYGNNTVNYTVAPNSPGQPARTGIIDVGGTTHIIFQSAGGTPTATSTPTRTSTNTPTATATGTPPSGRTGFDYDADRKSDISVFRPSNGAWYIQRSQAGFFGQQFGIATDKIAPADYDGDGKTDIAVYRPTTGVWYIFYSSNGAIVYHVFGIAEDLPVPADYDGDGRADICVFRPSNGNWHRQNSSNGAFISQPFGQNGDKPTIGDFDGDGRSDIAVWRPSNGAWYRINSSNGTTFGMPFGVSTDLVAQADYDGDNKTDVAVFRPSNNYWYIVNSSGNPSPITYAQWGSFGDIPSPSDFGGDGKADICVFRPSNGFWYWLNSSNGSFNPYPFGMNGDRPTQAAFRY